MRRAQADFRIAMRKTFAPPPRPGPDGPPDVWQEPPEEPEVSCASEQRVAVEKLLARLTPAQREAWRRSTGEPFTGALTLRYGPGPDHGPGDRHGHGPDDRGPGHHGPGGPGDGGPGNDGPGHDGPGHGGPDGFGPDDRGGDGGGPGHDGCAGAAAGRRARRTRTWPRARQPLNLGLPGEGRCDFGPVNRSENRISLDPTKDG